jgi:hypothetical protein
MKHEPDQSYTKRRTLSIGPVTRRVRDMYWDWAASTG